MHSLKKEVIFDHFADVLARAPSTTLDAKSLLALLDYQVYGEHKGTPSDELTSLVSWCNTGERGESLQQVRIQQLREWRDMLKLRHTDVSRLTVGQALEAWRSARVVSLLAKPTDDGQWSPLTGNPTPSVPLWLNTVR